jgi:hypothetical protein
MDLPPSGWYPDPYGIQGLLRWWDGTAWTDHTHTEAPAATTVQPAATTADPAAATVRPAVDLAATTIDPAVADATTVDPAPGQLAGFGPPAGPRTEPQPAIPAGYDATQNYGAAPGYGGPQNSGGPQDFSGTRVMTFGEGGPGFGGGGYSEPLEGTILPPGGRGGYAGYRAQRNRRILLGAGLTAAVLAAFAVIGLVIHDMGSTTPAPASEPAAAAASTAPAATTTPAATPTPTPTPSATPTSTLTDATTGLSYGQFSAPWVAGCPASLTNPAVFTWATGESAVAGTINNGQTPWYGEACSGALPAQYGYSGTADLENVATTLASTFNGTYYAALPHSFQQEQSVPVSVAGHPGWEVTFLQTYTAPQPGMAWTNEMGAVVVTDPGNGGAPAVFFTSVPQNLNESIVNTLVTGLQYTPVVPPASAPATPGSPAPGSPAPGSATPPG